MKKTSAIICLLTLLAAQIAPEFALGGDLMVPTDTESTSILPKKVWNPRFKVITLNLEDKFGSTGQREELGLKLNKAVTFQDVLNAQKDLISKEKVQAVMTQAGVSATDVAGSTTGVVYSYANVMVPVLAYGLTDKLTIAAAAPVQHIEISTDTGFVKTAQGQKFVNTAAASSELGASDGAAKLNDGVNQKLVENGYEPIRDQRTTALGDVQLIGKYQVYREEKMAVSAKLGLTLPTGRQANPDKVIDAATGDGQTDITMGGAYDYFLVPELRTGVAANYTAQLPDSEIKRIPREKGSSLSPDKENVSRDLGDILSLGTGIDYKVRRIGVTFGTGYTYQYAWQSSYDGAIFARERYRYLEELNPDSELHSITGSATFSTVDWFRKKQFVYPFEAKIVYNHPLAGRNASGNDLVMGELVLFF